jgi:phosphatidylglycerophosphate synthase
VLAASAHELSFERFGVIHALVLLCGFGAAAIVGHAWPLALVALVSFALLIGHGAGAWTASGRFGSANFVTAVRLSLTLALSLVHGKPGTWLVLWVLAILALDALDGFLARRYREQSAFGARFDMETDALLVMMVGLELWQRGQLGAWIVTAGLLRYLYVVTLALLPSRPPEMPRSSFGRNAFGLLMVGLCVALFAPAPFGTVAAALGTGAVTLSFARSFFWSLYGSRRVSSLPA